MRPVRGLTPIAGPSRLVTEVCGLVGGGLVSSTAMETTLVLLKPDAVRRGLVADILGRFERRGFRLRGIRLLHLDRATAEQHYAEHAERPFFGELVDFITGGPLVALALEGEQAIEVVRGMMGATDPKKSAPGTIRGDLAMRWPRTSSTAPTRPPRPSASWRSSSATPCCPERRAPAAGAGLPLAAAPRAADAAGAAVPRRRARLRRGAARRRAGTSSSGAQPREGALRRAGRPATGRCSASTPRSCSTTAACSASPPTRPTARAMLARSRGASTASCPAWRCRRRPRAGRPRRDDRALPPARRRRDRGLRRCRRVARPRGRVRHPGPAPAS